MKCTHVHKRATQHFHKKSTMLIMFQSDLNSSLKLASEHATDVLEPARVVGVGADRMNSS